MNIKSAEEIILSHGNDDLTTDLIASMIYEYHNQFKSEPIKSNEGNVWVVSNFRRPDKDGFYHTEDSVGEKSVTHFYDNHWHSLTGHPVVKWLDETHITPIKSNDDWSALAKIGTPKQWLGIYCDYLDLSTREDVAGWWQEQFNICNAERNELKKQNSNDVGDIEKAAENIFNIDVVKEIIFEFIDGKITIGKLTENLNNKIKLKNMEAGHTTHISEFLQTIDLITDYAISDLEKLKMIESEVKKEYARIGEPKNTITDVLEKAAQYYAVNTFGGHQAFSDFKAGAEWQSKQPIDIEKSNTIDEDELWREIMLEAEASISYSDFNKRCKKQFSITRKK